MTYGNYNYSNPAVVSFDAPGTQTGNYTVPTASVSNPAVYTGASTDTFGTNYGFAYQSDYSAANLGAAGLQLPTNILEDAAKNDRAAGNATTVSTPIGDVPVTVWAKNLEINRKIQDQQQLAQLQQTPQAATSAGQTKQPPAATATSETKAAQTKETLFSGKGNNGEKIKLSFDDVKTIEANFKDLGAKSKDEIIKAVSSWDLSSLDDFQRDYLAIVFLKNIDDSFADKMGVDHDDLGPQDEYISAHDTEVVADILKICEGSEQDGATTTLASRVNYFSNEPGGFNRSNRSFITFAVNGDVDGWFGKEYFKTKNLDPVLKRLGNGETLDDLVKAGLRADGQDV